MKKLRLSERKQVAQGHRMLELGFVSRHPNSRDQGLHHPEITLHEGGYLMITMANVNSFVS